jgi:hypothetical protein
MKDAPVSSVMHRDGAAEKSGRPDGVNMKILLQHARTALYLRGLGDWTANPFDAYDFQHSQKAIDFAHEHALGGVQIAVKFIDSQFDETFPLPPEAATTQPQVR